MRNIKSIKHKSITAVLISIIAIITLLVLGGCNNSNIKLSSLKTDGIFQYSDAKWIISPDEANRTLPFQIIIDEDTVSDDPACTLYKTQKNIRIDGYNASASFEFYDNRLRRIDFYLNSGEENCTDCFNTVSNKLKELYGTGETTADNDLTEIKWLSNETQLSVSEIKSDTNRENCVVISLVDIMQLQYISLSSLKTDGIFQYADAKWGVSPDEANKTLSVPIVKDKDRTPESERYINYKTEKNLKINGYDVLSTFEFAEDKLRFISFSFKSDKDEHEKCFETFSSELEKFYGTGKKVKSARGDSKIFWMLKDTKLDISEFSNCSDPLILISIADMSQYPYISIDKLYEIFNQ